MDVCYWQLALTVKLWRVLFCVFRAAKHHPHQHFCTKVSGRGFLSRLLRADLSHSKKPSEPLAKHMGTEPQTGQSSTQTSESELVCDQSYETLRTSRLTAISEFSMVSFPPLFPSYTVYRKYTPTVTRNCLFQTSYLFWSNVTDRSQIWEASYSTAILTFKHSFLLESYQFFLSLPFSQFFPAISVLDQVVVNQKLSRPHGPARTALEKCYSYRTVWATITTKVKNKLAYNYIFFSKSFSLFINAIFSDLSDNNKY